MRGFYRGLEFLIWENFKILAENAINTVIIINSIDPFEFCTRGVFMFLKYFLFTLIKGDECRTRASICIRRRVWHHNTALSFLWNTWTNFTFMQRQSHVYIPYNLFSGSLYFFPMFQSYRELVIITLQFAYRNIRFQDFSLSIISTDVAHW